MGARRWHQGGNAIDQIQWREVQFVDLGATLVRARLAVLFCAAVHQGGALFAQAVLSTWAAPGLWVCRVCAITRKKMRSTMLSTAPSRCMK